VSVCLCCMCKQREIMFHKEQSVWQRFFKYFCEIVEGWMTRKKIFCDEKKSLVATPPPPSLSLSLSLCVCVNTAQPRQCIIHGLVLSVWLLRLRCRLSKREECNHFKCTVYIFKTLQNYPILELHDTEQWLSDYFETKGLKRFAHGTKMMTKLLSYLYWTKRN